MAKKRKHSSSHVVVEEPREAPSIRTPPPPPESSSWSKSIRGVIGSITGSGNDFEISPVVNGATPAPRHFLSKLLSDVKSQGGRFTENFGLLASLAETTLFEGGLADDRKYQVGATSIQERAAMVSIPTRLSYRRWTLTSRVARANRPTRRIFTPELRSAGRPG